MDVEIQKLKSTIGKELGLNVIFLENAEWSNSIYVSFQCIQEMDYELS